MIQVLLLEVPPLVSVIVSFLVIQSPESSAIPTQANQSRGSQETSHNAGGDWMSPLDSPFPLEELEVWERPLKYDAGAAWGRGNAVNK